jgi:hypothetical protein
MEQLVAYLNEREFKTIDITNVLNEKTYDKYTKIATEKPYVVLYFKRNKKNDMYFEAANAIDKVNYFLMNKNNYLTTVVNETMDDNLKRYVDGFLDLTMEMSECVLCHKKNNTSGNCNKCFCSTCYTCIFEISVYDKNIDSIDHFKYKCPKCDHYITGLTMQKNVLI